MTQQARERSGRLLAVLLRSRRTRLVAAAAIIAVSISAVSQTGARALDDARGSVLYVGAPSVGYPSAREAGVASRSYLGEASPETLLALGLGEDETAPYVIERAMASITQTPDEGGEEPLTVRAALAAGEAFLAQTGRSGWEPNEGAPDAEEELASSGEPARPDLGDGRASPEDGEQASEGDAPESVPSRPAGEVGEQREYASVDPVGSEPEARLDNDEPDTEPDAYGPAGPVAEDVQIPTALAGEEMRLAELEETAEEPEGVRLELPEDAEEGAGEAFANTAPQPEEQAPEHEYYSEVSPPSEPASEPEAEPVAEIVLVEPPPSESIPTGAPTTETQPPTRTTYEGPPEEEEQETSLEEQPTPTKVGEPPAGTDPPETPPTPTAAEETVTEEVARADGQPEVQSENGGGHETPSLAEIPQSPPDISPQPQQPDIASPTEEGGDGTAPSTGTHTGSTADADPQDGQARSTPARLEPGSSDGRADEGDSPEDVVAEGGENSREEPLFRVVPQSPSESGKHATSPRRDGSRDEAEPERGARRDDEDNGGAEDRSPRREPSDDERLSESPRAWVHERRYVSHNEGGSGGSPGTSTGGASGVSNSSVPDVPEVDRPMIRWRPSGSGYAVERVLPGGSLESIYEGEVGPQETIAIGASAGGASPEEIRPDRAALDAAAAELDRYRAAGRNAPVEEAGDAEVQYAAIELDTTNVADLDQARTDGGQDTPSPTVSRDEANATFGDTETRPATGAIAREAELNAARTERAAYHRQRAAADQAAYERRVAAERAAYEQRLAEEWQSAAQRAAAEQAVPEQASPYQPIFQTIPEAQAPSQEVQSQQPAPNLQQIQPLPQEVRASETVAPTQSASSSAGYGATTPTPAAEQVISEQVVSQPAAQEQQIATPQPTTTPSVQTNQDPVGVPTQDSIESSTQSVTSVAGQ